MNLPRHLSLSIEHNEHKNYYENLEAFIRDQRLEDRFSSAEDMKAAIESDELWVMQWYPDNPTSCHIVAASTLGNCLEAALAVEAARK